MRFIVKQKGKYSHRISEDPNLRRIIDLGEGLLNNDHEFSSPYDINGFTIPTEDMAVGAAKPLPDIPDNKPLKDFVEGIRKDGVKSTKGVSKCFFLIIILLLLVVLIMVPFWQITKMWWGGNAYQTVDFDLSLKQDDSVSTIQNNSVVMYTILSAAVRDVVNSNDVNSHVDNHQQIVQQGNQSKDQGGVHFSTELHSYDWFIILFGVILTIAILVIIIFVLFFLRRCCELEHEERKKSIEYQNKLTSDYASCLYAEHRLNVQQAETNIDMDKQFKMMRLEYLQQRINAHQKEQENAWKYKNEHLKVVEESIKTMIEDYLKNWAESTSAQNGK